MQHPKADFKPALLKRVNAGGSTELLETWVGHHKRPRSLLGPDQTFTVGPDQLDIATAIFDMYNFDMYNAAQRDVLVRASALAGAHLAHGQ